MRKKIDINTDTIQSVRERNNKRYAFHETLGYISKALLRMRTRGNTSTSDDATNATDSNTAPQFKQKDAARFRPENASKRFKTDHVILGRLGVLTGVRQSLHLKDALIMMSSMPLQVLPFDSRQKFIAMDLIYQIRGQLA